MAGLCIGFFVFLIDKMIKSGFGNLPLADVIRSYNLHFSPHSNLHNSHAFESSIPRLGAITLIKIDHEAMNEGHSSLLFSVNG
jgi:hypothetical protein